MRRKWFVVACGLALLALCATGAALAQGPEPAGNGQPQVALTSAFTYQGQLNRNGSPVDDSCDMQFALWDAASAGSQIGATLTRTGVSVSGGLFTIPDLDLGASSFTGDARWLEVAVKCTGDADYTALAPRQALTAAPYALSLQPGATIAGSAYQNLIVNSYATAGGIPASIVGSIRTASDGVGVYGENEVTTSGANGIGVWGRTFTPGGYGVRGTGVSNGILGESTSTSGGWGVFGYSGSTVGLGYGVYGRSDSNEGRGVYAWAKATTGETYGVYALNSSDGGKGVYGYATATSGSTVGVAGATDSPGGTGVSGWASATTGSSSGVAGTSFAPTGAGVLGLAMSTAGEAYGVSGLSLSWEGAGVYGSGPWIGVRGKATGTANAVAVAGNADDTNCQTGFNGCWGIQGTSAGGYGAEGITTSGVGVHAWSMGSGTALFLDSQGGDLIQAYQGPIMPDRRFRVDINGNVYADGTYSSPAADMAELLPAVDGLEPGDVLVIGPDGNLTRSTQASQLAVVGVYSTKPAFTGGSSDDDTANAGKVPLAVVGVVPVKVSAENGPVHPGDMLTTSDTPGHAMKATPITVDGVTFYPSGTVLGKALQGLEKGTGIILVLVTVQ